MQTAFVLVTGATGFIAYHLIERLLQQGIPVVGIDNFDPFYDVQAKLRNLRDLERISQETGCEFKCYEGDLLGIAQLPLQDMKFSRVVHLAAKAGVRPSMDDAAAYGNANFQGTLSLLEFCRFQKITDFVFASSSSVYGNSTTPPFKENSKPEAPISIYGATKRAGEILVASYTHLFGIRSASLRFFTVYGPRQRPDLAIHKFAHRIQNGKKIELFAAQRGGRDYTHVSDTVEGIVKTIAWLAKQPPGTCEIFNLGSGRIIAIEEVVTQLEKALQKKANCVRVPVVSGDVEITFADLKKSQSLLGYSPQVDFASGIADFVRWFQEAQIDFQTYRKVV